MIKRFISIIRIFLIIGVFISLFPLYLSAQATNDAITAGTSWLLAVRYEMGIWAFDAPPDPLQTEFTSADFKKTYIRDTLEAVRTLQDLNIDPVEYASTLDWIELVEFLTTDRLGPKIRILSRAGKDTTEAINSILSFHNSDGGFGGAKGYPSDVFDTAEALQSLKAVNYSDQAIINSAISYLLSKQNSDGGFGFSQGDSSSIFITALTSCALQQFPRTTSITTAINKATDYLVAHQNTDGGWGSPTSTVYETALVYLALVGQTTDATVLGNAINYLTSTQLPNGSWEDDPYSTALALRALANVKPNLSISSTNITFSNPAPTAGETITISANIKNTGPGQAPSTGSGQVTVQFYDGDPSAGGVLIGETTISSIPSFGSSQASVNYTIPTASSKTIFIQIDPLNSFDNLYSVRIANNKGFFGNARNVA